MGGGERQWAEELRAFRAARVCAKGAMHEASRKVLDQLSLDDDHVELLAGRGGLQRMRGLRRWLLAAHPRLLVSYTSPELTYLAALGTGVPCVLYLNDPFFYNSYAANPYPFALQHRAVYRELAASAPGYLEFASPPEKLRPFQRLRLEARAFLRSIAIRNAAAVIVLSNRAAAELKSVYGITATVVRGCLDERLASHAPRLDVRAAHGLGGKPLFVSISRLDPLKRVDLVIRAFAELCAAVPNATLLIGGTGSDEALLHRLACELGVSDQVIFTGYLGQDVVWDYYAAADVFVAPAVGDFNIAPYEALALGRKVVLAVDLEIEDWISDSGWIYRAWPTTSAFARAMLAALSSPGPSALDLSSLTWSARVRKLLPCFETIAGGPLAPPAFAQIHAHG